ncbi:Calcium/calmodulin-dependent protein kinase type I [Marasmius crinis-equi]|uniref:Calcium/calmodulin-dependent protein kinase type I n=1 Tax=Marasmius crinis-equi TaxID=585013 RepID=A0ABR3G1J9_9AGAR
MGTQQSKSPNPSQQQEPSTNDGTQKAQKLLNRMSMKFKSHGSRTSLKPKVEEGTSVASFEKGASGQHQPQVEEEQRPAPEILTGGQETSNSRATETTPSDVDSEPPPRPSAFKTPSVSQESSNSHIANANRSSHQHHQYQSSAIMPSNTTVPCQYRTGRTLGSGTYAIVKEAIHIKTGKYYACKVINKKLMEGREYMVRNEIAVLKRISSGNRNVVTLHDYFETAHNLYLCFDLCTGGELFDRICAKGNYYEADAADLVRTILRAVKYIHSAGIVHRDLKPENLLFRTPAEDADIMIADFGLSRLMDEDKLNMLTEICGTPGYMAPEIFKKTGHGKPVDVWAMGVIAYFLLAGYTPFDRDSQQAEMEAIIAGDYKFEPHEYWANVSDTARDFIRDCLTIDPANRPTAEQALNHKWLADDKPHFVPDPTSPTGGPTDLLPHVKKAFNAKQLWRKAAFSIRAVNRMSALAGAAASTDAQKLRGDVAKFKEESEKEVMEESSIIHHHDDQGRQTKARAEALKSQDDINIEDGKEPRTSGNADVDHLENRMARASLQSLDEKEIEEAK